MFRMPRLHRRQRSRGQGIVEFALILPVLILMLLITLDFGRLFMSYITLTNTTRVAANYGSVNPGMFTGTPNTTTYNAVVARESAGLNCALKPDAGGHNPPIPTFPGALGSGLGGTSLVAMTCNFSLLTPFMTNFFGGPLPISAKAEFPIRTVPSPTSSGTTTLPPPGIADRRVQLHRRDRRDDRRRRERVRRRIGHRECQQHARRTPRRGTGIGATSSAARLRLGAAGAYILAPRARTP